MEVLVSRLQVQLCSVERSDDAHCGGDIVVMRPEGERNCVGALVDDFLCVIPEKELDNYDCFACNQGPLSFYHL